MTVILLITLSVILLYLLYPAYLMLHPRYSPQVPDQPGKEPSVSLVLLTYNGIEHVEEKLRLLSVELEQFKENEFIVIDDDSTDGTRELLASLKERHNLNLILKNEHSGIPHSMNLGVQLSRHDHLVFCDQRQKFSGNILRDLLKPLQNDEVGAVSCYLSCAENNKHGSFLRRHENFIKRFESRTGCLVGVYGPLYTIKKSCYRAIGENIILDDLWLSLSILSSKRIIMVENCMITDDEFGSLYNFKRAKRYLRGLLQVLLKTDLFRGLPARIKIMLLWHKYLRLLIPPMMVVSYLATAVMVFVSRPAAVIFICVSFLILTSFIARRLVIFSNLNTFFRINVYYFFSMIFMAYHRLDLSRDGRKRKA
jgi:glycosyltransferase involved in cell wall biosynthesis